MTFRATEQYVKIMGRTIFRDGIRYLGYSASAISFRFRGTKAGATLISDADAWSDKEKAWVAVFINDDKEPSQRIKLEANKQDVILYEAASEQEITVTLMKYSEAEYASCGVVEIDIFEGQCLEPPAKKEHFIEIFGDSITCGYGVEGNVEDLELDTAKENPMKSYSMKVVNNLDVDANIVAWNGKGVITEYIGDDCNEKNDSWLMPYIYQYTDAGRERDYFKAPEEKWEKWEFTSRQPEMVLIYLGTNDCSYVRDIPERHEEFIEGYVKMLEMIQEKNPRAKIMCTIGTMDPRLNESIPKAVDIYNQKSNEEAVRFVLLPEQLESDGLGTFWHPTEATNKKSAAILTAEIKDFMGW